MQPPPNFHAAAPARSPRKGPSIFFSSPLPEAFNDSLRPPPSKRAWVVRMLSERLITYFTDVGKRDAMKSFRFNPQITQNTKTHLPVRRRGQTVWAPSLIFSNLRNLRIPRVFLIKQPFVS